jgi:hypothetical protein
MLAYLFVLLALVMRIPSVPHAWGFTPVTAALLYFGARGSRRQMWLPFALLVAMDVILNKFVYSYPLSWDLLLTWVWYAAMLWLGSRLREDAKPLPVLGAALTGSVSFFVVSNFGVWTATAMYPKTLAGLTTCYAAAIPFFRRGLEGDLLFTAMMFGLPVVAAALAHSMSKPHGPAAA